MFKKKQRFTINLKDLAAEADKPLNLVDIVVAGDVKEKKGRRDGKKMADRRRDKRKETPRDEIGEGVSENEDSEEADEVPREPDS